MGLFENQMPMCPQDKNCSKWAEKYMSYCLCSARQGASLTLGLISVISWGVAEIPQIITNYKDKSAEGLSIAFLTTWMIGDLFNLCGCLLEPATLPTQFYMAMLYTFTTTILYLQAIYYGHVYPRLEYRRAQKVTKQRQSKSAGKADSSVDDIDVKRVLTDRWRNGADSPNGRSSPIPLPVVHENSSSGRELYYMSARSLSSSHTPPAGSCLVQKMTPPSSRPGRFLEEPLLHGHVPGQSASPPSTKTMLCLVSAFMFLGTFNLQHLANSGSRIVPEKSYRGFVVQVGRKLLQVGSSGVAEGSSGIGMYFGWAMAVIYLGGRLPQIFLNIRRGHVEGLNPLMFFFALVGNSTYVASILVNSVEWSRIKPNLPWLVDAGGCVLLDSFILIQFIYFRCRSLKEATDKCEASDAA